ncbi:MAG: hypothetical protein DMG83_16105 [Acidobacteria bacterium]|nr:MAG: hypothetical protein DMG83_16105 [Acidobacteriota bacterium]
MKAWSCRFAIGALAFLASAQFVQSSETPSIPAAELVRLTVQNEIRASENPGARHMFSARKETSRGSQTKLYCETRDAMAGMAIANDDKPLTPQQRQAEEARLDQLVNSPAELARKRQKEKEDADHITRIVRAMPDAFFFEYDGTMPGQSGLGKDGSELIRLKFRPNPKYDPPTHVEQVLQGMQGLMLIDARTHRIARIDGTLFRDVGFGWGILGHLDKGGHFLVEQSDVGDGSWDMSRMSLAFTGKIMIFKKLDIKSTETYSDFRPVPNGISFAQGVDLLKKQEAMLAENGRLETNPK